MNNILVIAEHDNQNLKPATLNTITAAQAIGGDITVLVAGHNCEKVAAVVSRINNIKKVLVADADVYEHFLAENLATLITKLVSGFNYILAPATTFGKNFMPRVAALLDVGQISDIIKIIDANTFVRPIYAGNALATVKNEESIKVITVRSTAFSPAVLNDKTIVIEKCNIVVNNEFS